MRYIDDVLSIDNDKFHTYINAIYPNELDILDTTDSSIYAFYLDILLTIDTARILTTKLYDKRDVLPNLSRNISLSTAYGVSHS